MRHADDDVLHPELAAALDDLLHRGDQALAAIKAEALRAHILDMQVFLEPLGLDHLFQDRLPALAGEGDFLAVAFDPLLEPVGLVGVGNVHVLQREGAAIGAAHDVEDLAHGCDLKAQNIVDEDRAIHVGFGEAVGFRVELRPVGLIAQAKRVEIGDQVATDAVGADQHQRAHGIEHGALDDLVADLDALSFGLGGDLLADLARGGLVGPFAGQGRSQIIVGDGRPVGARPGRAAGLFLDLDFGIAELRKERLPGLVNRVGIVGVTRIELFEIFGVVPLHEAGGVELVIGRMVGHWFTSCGARPSVSSMGLICLAVQLGGGRRTIGVGFGL